MNGKTGATSSEPTNSAGDTLAIKGEWQLHIWTDGI